MCSKSFPFDLIMDGWAINPTMMIMILHIGIKSHSFTAVCPTTSYLIPGVMEGYVSGSTVHRGYRR